MLIARAREHLSQLSGHLSSLIIIFVVSLLLMIARISITIKKYKITKKRAAHAKLHLFYDPLFILC